MLRTPYTLTINIATRNRPSLLLTTMESMVLNIRNEQTTLMVSVDEDDEKTQQALNVSRIGKNRNVLVSVRPREDSRGEKYDRALKEAPANVYLPAVDCVPVLTPGFDDYILWAANLFPDQVGCVYTPLANASFPILQAPTSKLVEKIGYIYSHDYPFWFIDHELDDICRIIDRISYVDLICDHTSMRPEKTIGLRDLQFWCAYFDAGRLERRRKAHKIIREPGFYEQPWRKEILLRHHPLIEYRSLWVNECVRRDIPAIEATRGGDESEEDERYKRIKARAEKKLLEMYNEIEEAAKAA